MVARGALAALDGLSSGGEDAGFLEAKLVTARFYAEHYLPQATGLLAAMVEGGRSTLALDEGQF